MPCKILFLSLQMFLPPVRETPKLLQHISVKVNSCNVQNYFERNFHPRNTTQITALLWFSFSTVFQKKRTEALCSLILTYMYVGPKSNLFNPYKHILLIQTKGDFYTNQFLTLSQMTKFRLFHFERDCRRQF